MYEPVPEDYSEDLKPDIPNWVTAIIMMIAVIILVVAFVWTFIRLEPWLDDFIPADDAVPAATATPEPEG